MLSALIERLAARNHRPARARLGVECLERRDCPTPVLSYSVTYGDAKHVTFSGHVSGATYGFAAVMFSGAASASVTTNMSGNFSVQVDASALGVVHGSAFDMAQGSSSAVVDVTLSSDTPEIVDFAAVHGTGNYWTFSGRLSDESPGGLSVIFGGLSSLSAHVLQVGSDGTFTATIELAQGEFGTATAHTMDWWGLMSSTAETSVYL
jgi:hypothetical protein